MDLGAPQVDVVGAQGIDFAGAYALVNEQAQQNMIAVAFEVGKNALVVGDFP